MSDQDLRKGKEQHLRVGRWRIDPEYGFLRSDSEDRRLEPRVALLLSSLIAGFPRVMSRERLIDEVWGDTVVGEDALPQAMSKLRKALGDNVQSPHYVETVPRRGYRLLVAPVLESNGTHRRHRHVALAAVAVSLAIGLLAIRWFAVATHERTSAAQVTLERAHDLYYHFERGDAEAAGALYQQLIDFDPDMAGARAGLANILVQRVIRWPSGRESIPLPEQTLVNAIESQRAWSPWGRETLKRAETLARSAIALAPEQAEGYKALGLILALTDRLPGAEQQYRNALNLDPDHWPAQFNLAELALVAGNRELAIERLVAAYDMMENRYQQSPQRVRTWQAEVGILVANLHSIDGNVQSAQVWFEKVIEKYPWNTRATIGLASVMFDSGHIGEARTLCDDLMFRIGPTDRCEPFLKGRNLYSGGR